MVNGSWWCLNEGTCVDTDGDYYCQCPPGVTGKNCQSKFPLSSHTIIAVKLSIVIRRLHDRTICCSKMSELTDKLALAVRSTFCSYPIVIAVVSYYQERLSKFSKKFFIFFVLTQFRFQGRQYLLMDNLPKKLAQLLDSMTPA